MRFAHVSITARDWQQLAKFYITVLGCRLKPPQRRLSGDWLARGTGVADAALQGVHLELPGCGKRGPTLEIFTYARTEPSDPILPNHQGYGHLAFEVADVAATVRALLAHGGSLLGEITEQTIDGVGLITFVYARDPEGNVLELQSWRRVEA